MEIKESFKNSHYKILDVTLNAGETMPLHKASSDAYIINKKGKGKLSFTDEEIILEQGASILIPANKPHQLEILEDFKSSVILEPNAKIDFV